MYINVKQFIKNRLIKMYMKEIREVGEEILKETRLEYEFEGIKNLNPHTDNLIALNKYLEKLTNKIADYKKVI